MSQQKDDAKITDGQGPSGDEQAVLTTRQGHRDLDLLHNGLARMSCRS